MNILIALPAYRNEVAAECTTSLIRVHQLFTNLHIPSSLRKIDNTDVVRARNLFGAAMLESTAYTHLLFIDNDMDFQPDTIRKMIDTKVPLIGVVAPRRELDLQKFYESAKTLPFAQALSSAMQFNVRTTQRRDVTIRDGIGSVDGVGLAISLIERKVFESLTSNPAVRRERGSPLYGFFDQIVTPDGGMLSEDHSFCERWRTLCGGEIKAVFDQVGHHGVFRYSAKYPGVP